MGFAKISAGVLPRSGGSRLSDKGRGGGEPVSNEFGIRVGREKGAGMRAEDTPPPRLLADPELPPLFHFLNFGKRKQYLIHPHQRQQKQQIVFRFNI